MTTLTQRVDGIQTRKRELLKFMAADRLPDLGRTISNQNMQLIDPGRALCNSLGLSVKDRRRERTQLQGQFVAK